jgi:hypothetical protein
MQAWARQGLGQIAQVRAAAAEDLASRSKFSL